MPRLADEIFRLITDDDDDEEEDDEDDEDDDDDDDEEEEEDVEDDDDDDDDDGDGGDDDDDADDENQNMRLAHCVRTGIRPILAFQRTACTSAMMGPRSLGIKELVLGIPRGTSEAQPFLG